MMYLHYDPITTALLPYFLGLVYLYIFCWVRSELSQPALSGAVSTVTPDELSQPALSGEFLKPTFPKVDKTTIRPEQVFQLLEQEAPQTTSETARNPKSFLGMGISVGGWHQDTPTLNLLSVTGE